MYNGNKVKNRQSSAVCSINKLVLQLFKRPLLQETLAQWLQSWIFLVSLILTLTSNTLILIGTGWQAWREEFDYFIAAANITNDKQKMNLLLHHAGPEVWKIFKKHCMNLRKKGRLSQLVILIYGSFLPKKSVVYKRFIYGEAVQEPHESIDQFATRLRNLSDHCQFENVNDTLRDQLVKAFLSTKRKKFQLREGSREGGQWNLRSLLNFRHAQKRGKNHTCQINNSNFNNNNLGHVYVSIRGRKMAMSKLSKLSSKQGKSGKTLLLSQKKMLLLLWW